MLLKAGEVRRPYFAHAQSDVSCRHRQRPEYAGRSYEHLHYQNALVAWLKNQGLTARIEHTFDRGGRADLQVFVDGLSHTIEVQLSSLTDASWTDRDALYRQSVDQVTWLYGPHAGTGAGREQAVRGWALLIDQDVALGVRSHSTEAWSLLDDCPMTGAGILVPGLREAMDEHAAIMGQREAAEQEAADRERTQRRARDREEHRGRHAWSEVPYQTREAPGSIDPFRASLTAWRAFHPESELFVPRRGWSFLETVAETDHEAARFIAYLCEQIYGAGPVNMFAVTGVSNPARIVNALQQAGMVTLLEIKGVSGWTRA
ncbi:competence protein CoiA [Ornithinimicrobium sp. F0845]|uniref:competence protein CoiA family protein n=1 Tax=Ornithinimicrobium sp. F0845 TaxID=2926412 RepID=UPI001FF6D961|nr:competence protein CoiA family protein [Ornithinimicrobium sp. F0845]MCK0112835.1 competence protein CoiA [Ornithinimicrobium sp. F0845]